MFPPWFNKAAILLSHTPALLVSLYYSASAGSDYCIVFVFEFDVSTRGFNKAAILLPRALLVKTIALVLALTIVFVFEIDVSTQGLLYCTQPTHALALSARRSQ